MTSFGDRVPTTVTQSIKELVNVLLSSHFFSTEHSIWLFIWLYLHGPILWGFRRIMILHPGGILDLYTETTRHLLDSCLRKTTYTSEEGRQGKRQIITPFDSWIPPCEKDPGSPRLFESFYKPWRLGKTRHYYDSYEGRPGIVQLISCR